MPIAVFKGGSVMEKRTVRISQKRQITIPQKFFAALGFKDSAECVVRGNELIIRPLKEVSGGEFSEQILADLIAQGFSGDALLGKFKDAQRKVRPAVNTLLEDAKSVASGNGDYETYDDVFKTEE